MRNLPLLARTSVHAHHLTAPANTAALASDELPPCDARAASMLQLSDIHSRIQLQHWAGSCCLTCCRAACFLESWLDCRGECRPVLDHAALVGCVRGSRGCGRHAQHPALEHTRGQGGGSSSRKGKHNRGTRRLVIARGKAVDDSDGAGVGADGEGFSNCGCTVVIEPGEHTRSGLLGLSGCQQ